MKISNQLKKARQNKKLTQEYVASQINVSRKTISSWENGHGHPNSEYLKKLNSIYNTNLQFHYTQNKDITNKNYINVFYFINIILFILCLLNIFTGLFVGIILFQLIFTSFFFITYKINILNEIKNKKKNLFIYFLIFLIFLIIIMNNLEIKYNFSNVLEDTPFAIGAIFHSLILTASFFIITNYRKGK
ncbi:helix-turn-helix transcriptional regulator [Apilactobacillus timberlakei]|uniref:helix-turn-helix transcriptional regulator n=1 Tax=Apilactobacillus timberlakei TaxID=2008380 RepID=UPI00112EDFF8|nr:helix-turn-helix transcriptional regulator [Apilactobacillus timberlakei]TPR19286.1 helix-turn-helix domain-containing protein [Apilactobacillus timberlakei]